jgi:ribosomal protein L7/L12
MSMIIMILGTFLLIAVVGGMIAVFLINRSWGSSLDRGSALPRLDQGIPRPAAPSLTGDVATDARAIMQSGSKIEAIKRVRQLTGMGLKEAKDYVEALERGEAPPQPESVPLAGPLAPEEMDYAARMLVGQGNKIDAIKLVREQTGMGLKEAKDYVDGLK